MKKNKSTIIWVIVIVIVIVGLFALPRFLGNNPSLSGGGVPCIAQGVPLNYHIHPRLTITADGEAETIPGTIGNSPCLRQIHTHDRSGELHVEPQGNVTSYSLGDFFKVWGKSIERDGYGLKTTVDGAEVENPAGIILEDGQQILIEYRKIE